MKHQPRLIVEHRNGQYPIFIEAGWLDDLSSAIGELFSSIAVISDDNVFKRYAAGICQSLEANGTRVHPIQVPVGETSKSLDQFKRICDELLVAGLDRQSGIAAIGGGVVGDLAGFVAATWMRGIDFVQVPTTLLAQVDSSVGGKTGVNLTGSKNAVGVFWQPRAVFMDTALLSTLGAVDFTSGLAEVVKYAVILDADFFDFLENHIEPLVGRDPDVLTRVVLRCCQLKAEVVRQDERETSGLREILNYGHTFGHAIESVFEYGTWPHGHAVAAGMMAAACLAESMDLVDDQMVQRQYRLLDALGIPPQFPGARHDEMIQAMNRDKKVVQGRPRFVLPTRIGHVELFDAVEPRQVTMAMQRATGAGP